jgi:sugar lactone lactonase YvrE
MRTIETTVLANDFVFPEGPRWRDGSLWLSDMWDFCVYRLKLDGTRQRVADVPQRPSGLGFLPDGTPLVVSMVDRRVLKILHGRTSVYADLSGVATGDANDMVVDAEGRIYVSNFGYDIFGGAKSALADIALIDTDGSVGVAASAADFPNGMLVSLDGRMLIVAETWAHRLIAYDRLPDGRLAGRRIYAELGERTPDGICLDEAGGIWVSSFLTDEFVRIVEGGVVTDRLDCSGRRAVACELGGDDGRTLFCLTFDGHITDIVARKRAGAVEIAHVEVPAARLA